MPDSSCISKAMIYADEAMYRVKAAGRCGYEFVKNASFPTPLILAKAV